MAGFPGTRHSHASFLYPDYGIKDIQQKMHNGPDGPFMDCIYFFRSVEFVLERYDLIRHILGKCRIQIGKTTNNGTIYQLPDDFPLVAALVTPH